MAAKKTTLPAKQASRQISTKLVIANLVEPGQENYELPEAFTEEFDVEEIGGLNPTVDFQIPGACVFGEWRGIRELTFGNRKQMLYTLKPDARSHPGYEAVSIWGSTVLDRMILEANPQLGEMILVRYVGEGKNADKGNPAKLFQVARLKAKS